MRERWGLRVRVLAAAALIGTVAIASFAVLLWSLHEQHDAIRAARRSGDALAATATLEALALDLETGTRGYVITRDRAYLGPYEDARRRLAGAVGRLIAMPLSPDQRVRALNIRADMYSYAAGYLAGVIRDARDGDSSASSAATSKEGKRRLDALRAEFAGFNAIERARQIRRRAQTDHALRVATVVTGAGLGLLLLLLLLAAIGSARLVVPVGRLVAFASLLRQGRLDARLPERGPPELAELARAFNASAAALQRAETERRDAADLHLAELDAVFNEAPLGLAFVDAQLRFMRVNEALARMNRRPAAEHLGRRVDEVVDDPELVLRALEQVLETGRPVLDLEATGPPLRPGGDPRTFQASYFPVRGAGDTLLAVGVSVADISARRRAEAGRARLQAATAALARAVTLEEVVAAVLEQGRGALGAREASLLLLGGDRETLELVGVDGVEPELAQRFGVVPPDAGVPAHEAVRTGRAIFCGTAEELARYPGLPSAAEQPWAEAYACLPLVASGDVLGALSLRFADALEFGDSERELLLALAAQGAVAIARAQLYEREHSVSHVLQASLLPRALPDVQGLDVAARLEPGTAGIEVGGDFYDLFAIDEDVWGIVIGDVCGKGVNAAALTALARHTVRAAAQLDASPAGVLRALNHAVVSESLPGQFLTAVFGRLEARRDGFRLKLACGGHPPPVVLDRELVERKMRCTGTLLGVVPDPEIVDTGLDLRPGDTMLLYTDGLSEAGAPGHTLTPQEVVDLLAGARGRTADETARRCLEAALAPVGGVQRDDVALLVLQVPEAPRRPEDAEERMVGEPG